MTKRLSYAVPPYGTDDQPSTRTFAPLPAVEEVALLVRGGEMVPGLIVGDGDAVTLTWRQALDLHRVLGEWIGYAADIGKAGTSNRTIVGSEELVK